MVLTCFIIIHLDFRFIVRGLKLELKVLVYYLLCDLIACLPCTGNGSIKY